MKTKKYSTAPLDAQNRLNIKPTICYPIDDLKDPNLSILHTARKDLKKNQRNNNTSKRRKNF